MTKAKSTKRALLMSVLSMMLCITMLIGSTFAWFTDTVTTGTNRIVAGNLDVELEYLDADGKWQKVTEETKLFSELEADGETENLWEPGHTEVVYLKIKNAGTLALRYKLSVNVAKETAGINVEGKEFKLSDHIVFGQKESETLTTYTTREDAWKAVGSTKGLSDYAKNSKLVAGAEEYVALVAYMPTTVGNEANYRGESIPTIELGINLVATQDTVEADSFDENYDANATLEGEVVKYAFENASDAIAFCPDCYNAGTTAGHAEHAEYLIVKDGVAEVQQTGAWLAFKDLDWENNTYALDYDVDLKMLAADAFIAFDAGETTTWKDLQVGFKRTESGIEVYKTLFDNSLNAAKLLGEIGEKVHITYTFTPKATDLLMLATVTDGVHTYTVENTVSNFPSNTVICWDVYTAVGDEDTYAALDNVVFSVSPLAQSDGWDGSVDEDGLVENTNKEEKTVYIDTPEQLAAFAQDVNSGETYQGYTIKLTSDINLNNIPWTPIGDYMSDACFNGSFDGQGHTIKNLNCETYMAGLFGQSAWKPEGPKQLIKNFTVENANIVATNKQGQAGFCAAVVYGNAGPQTDFEDIIVKGDIIVTADVEAYYMAVIVAGRSWYGTMNNCHVYANEGSYVECKGASYINYTAGLAAWHGEGTKFVIQNSSSNIDIKGVYATAGLLGIAQYGNMVENCTVGLNQDGTMRRVNISRSLTSGDNQDANDIGGIVGMITDDLAQNVCITNCTGKVHFDIDFGNINHDGVIGNNYRGNDSAIIVIKDCEIDWTKK